MSDKKNIRDFIVTVVPLLVFCVCLLFITASARTYWEKGLKKTVQTVLVPFADEYEVTDFVPEKTPFSVSSAVYKLRKKAYPKEDCYAVIIKATAMYGAVPLVYIFDEDNYIFAGKGYETVSDLVLPEPIIEFWAKRAKALIPPQKAENK
ncbi:MAG: hypothetical protein J6Y75_00310 [Spirochaetaceae bacterium]|nr:hypothetical protein [Spirochaetaceae bacterium]MBP5328324.1 hypothetical protein [Spirochaetaceae bacterium]